MNQRLPGKVVIITGAAQGIGRAYAVACAAAGANVCVSDIAEPNETVSAVTAAGGKAIGVAADVRDQSSLDALVDRALSTYGRLDVLVNNAAIFGTLGLKPFSEIAADEWDSVMAVNVRGTWQAVKAAAPAMRRSGGGKIINIASGTVFKGNPNLLHYVTSKGAIISMTRSLARELADDNICVNAIAPGLVMSESVQKHPDWGKVTAAIVASRALKRDQTPQDLIGALFFLASSDSDFMTGQTIVVDGGSVMH